MVQDDEERMFVRTLSDMNPNEDIYLIDHLWTFKQKSITTTLMQHEQLRDRLENLISHSDKDDLPGPNKYSKKK